MIAYALMLACTGDPETDDGAAPGEGVAPGDCTDRADNDADGDFDCNDDGCAGSPDCVDTGDTDDTDTDTDTGTDDTDTDDTDDTAPGTACSASFTLVSAEGSSYTFDACAVTEASGTWEFDPDDPPKVRSFELRFDAAEESAFDCSVALTVRGYCEPGYHRIDGDASELELVTYDCDGLATDAEGEYAAQDGWVRIDDASNGDAVGDFSGTIFENHWEGAVGARFHRGATLHGSFSLTADALGEDAEEVDCLGSDGDFDDDGYLADWADGDDCDDSQPGVAPGTWESDDSIDSNCDGYDGPTVQRFDTYAFHICVVDSNAELRCWQGYGGYDNGQVVNPSGAWLDVATSYDSTCALDDAGEITCWGNWDASVLPAGPFTDLSMSDQMGCAWDAASSLTCWTSAGAYTVRRRSSDPITHGTCTDGSCYFLTDAGEVELATAGGSRTSLESGTYTTVETGMGGFYCLLDTAGELACASGDRGSDSPDAGPFTTVGLGALHACGQREPGAFACWGDDQSGQSGAPSGTELVAHMQGGYTHTCGLTPDGVMVCWGVSASVGSFPSD